MPEIDGWTTAELGKLVEIKIGGTPSRANNSYWADEYSVGFAWCSIADLKQREVFRTKERITDAGVAASNVKAIAAGTLLASFKLSLGRMAIAGVDLYTNEAIAALVPRECAEDTRFLFHALPSAFANVAAETAVKGATLNLSSLSSLQFQMPISSAERSLIADILDAIDDSILSTETSIEKHEAIRVGLLDDLIAMPAKVGQSEAPDTLADMVTSISSGCSVNADDRPPIAGELGVLKTSAVGGGRFQPHQSKAVWRKEVSRLKCPVTKGTIVFNRKNTPELVGGSAYVAEDYPGLFLPDLLWSLQVGESDVDPEWVATLMQTRPARAYVTRQATGTSKSMVNISQPLLLSMPLRKLPERDQADAMKAVRSMQTEIDRLTSERTKLSWLRNGLRDDLLTGRRPVVPIREAAE
ncbi:MULTISPECIES: restriction endonuclease subunit S [unclassified Bradyrhizobium]|uniref:restriction endonuclease subunit S n=1 Tax=unclassified Bradyrhizobium TaxID=2631580 RepID=UPI0028EF85FA|nr:MULTISPECIES: restriction endonuclease subunit S [unclassified Bradyrhizobium]